MNFFITAFNKKKKIFPPKMHKRTCKFDYQIHGIQIIVALLFSNDSTKKSIPLCFLEYNGEL